MRDSREDGEDEESKPPLTMKLWTTLSALV